MYNPYVMLRHQKQIIVDIERYSGHYKALGRQVATATFCSMEDVVQMVDSVETDLAEKLSGSDERAVLRELDWPFGR